MINRSLRKSALAFLFILCAAAPAWLEGSKEKPAAGQARLPRVVTGGKAYSLVLNALYMFPEAPQSLVAFGRTSQVGGNFVFFLDPQAESRALLSPNPGAEEILAHNPDWVVLKSYLKDGLGSQLQELGVQVLYVELESPEQYRRDITAMGEVFGDPGRAEALNHFFQENLKQVQQMSAGLQESEIPDTVLLYYSTRSGTTSFNVPPKQWLQTGLVRWAGGRPVWLEDAAGAGWQQVSFEQIAAWNPEYVFLVSYHTPVEDAKETLLQDSKWMQLRAVKEGKLFAFPADYLSWDQPDPRWLIGLYWLAAKLHPQRITAGEVRNKVKEFYGFVYGLSDQQTEEAIIPMIRGDYP
jgi:iron complex transport system substrate-binding protein